MNYFILKKNFFKTGTNSKYRFYKTNLSFFLKKNFLKILTKSRLFFSRFFFGPIYKRQKELTIFFSKLLKKKTD